MKKAVLKPPSDFSLTRLDEVFTNALRDCVISLEDALFYYNLPFFPQIGVDPALIITSDTLDSELFVRVIHTFAQTTNFNILPKAEAVHYLSRVCLKNFV